MRTTSVPSVNMRVIDSGLRSGTLPRIAFLVVLGVLASAIDLAASILYWSQHGVPATQVLRSVASWVLGPRPPATGLVFTIGLSLYFLIYLAMVTVLERLLSRGNGHKQSWFATGASYGLAFYVIVYELVVPLMTYPIVVNRSIEWVASCVLLHGLIIGPLLARTIHCRRTDTT